MENWACVNFSLMGTTETQKFASELKKACVAIGMVNPSTLSWAPLLWQHVTHLTLTLHNRI